MAKLLIGVPTRNRPDYLKDTIESLLRQTCGDWQVVVSDNCSTSENARLAKEYVEGLGDSRFEFYQQSEDGGEYGQGRYLFARSQSSEYFIILHDDDVLLPDYVATAFERLDEDRSRIMFVANPYVYDEYMNRSDENTKWYFEYHGRNKTDNGEFDILDQALLHGLVAISGTCFRVSALNESGFVGQTATGCYPFELDLFLRLGDCGFKGWFEKRELLGFRFHEAALRKTLHVIQSPEIVNRMIELLGSRAYTGPVEKRRRILLGRLHRAQSLNALAARDYSLARKEIVAAFKLYPFAMRTFMLTLLVLTVPHMLPPFIQKHDVAVPPSLKKGATH